MFVDLVKITLKSGKGGDGIVAFRREKYVPKGGPSGGDGGDGGHVVFVGDEGLSTLLDLQYKKSVTAQDGENGKPKRMHGKRGENIRVRVPVGTVVYDEDDGKLLSDITRHQQEAVLLKGGRGGRGNVRFTSSRNTAPEIAEKGEPGHERNVRVELKLLADVGLIGLPNVGKSTLISAISKSRPKIADYPFTTLVPNLGVAGVPDGRSFVAADMPGLIKGAAQGQGLGLQFLRHIERTRVLLHLLDMSPVDAKREPYDDYQAIRAEIGAYREDLLERPEIIVANKMDMPGAFERLDRFRKRYGGPHEVVPISAYTRNNIDLLLLKTADRLDKAVAVSAHVNRDADERVEYTFEADKPAFTITRGSDGIFDIDGDAVKRLFEMTDFSRDQAVRRFARQLRSLGVDAALREHGVEHGDTVRICGNDFDFQD